MVDDKKLVNISFQAPIELKERLRNVSSGTSATSGFGISVSDYIRKSVEEKLIKDEASIAAVIDIETKMGGE